MSKKSKSSSFDRGVQQGQDLVQTGFGIFAGAAISLTVIPLTHTLKVANTATRRTVQFTKGTAEAAYVAVAGKFAKKTPVMAQGSRS